MTISKSKRAFRLYINYFDSSFFFSFERIFLGTDKGEMLFLFLFILSISVSLFHSFNGPNFVEFSFRDDIFKGKGNGGPLCHIRKRKCLTVFPYERTCSLSLVTTYRDDLLPTPVTCLFSFLITNFLLYFLYIFTFCFSFSFLMKLFEKSTIISLFGYIENVAMIEDIE